MYLITINKYNPSFVWRSIWEAKDVIKEGISWMVGSGEKIDICNQPWLQDVIDPYITSNNQVIQQNKVSSLMRIGDRSWDEKIVKDLFNERDQSCILSTRIHNRLADDRLYWSRGTSGSFSVKSAYRMLRERKPRGNYRENSKFWACMWRIKAPAKILNLVWRVASDVLPTLCSLKQRHVPVVSTYPIYNGVDESTVHALVMCPKATQVLELDYI